MKSALTGMRRMQAQQPIWPEVYRTEILTGTTDNSETRKYGVNL
jgi:hypothetical protein